MDHELLLAKSSLHKAGSFVNLKTLSTPPTKSQNRHTKIRKKWRLLIIRIRFGVRLRRIVRCSPLTLEEFRLAKGVYDKYGLIQSYDIIHEMLQSLGLFSEDFRGRMDQLPFREGQHLRLSAWIFLLEMLKREYQRAQRVTDTDDAYIALGGTEDKAGNIETSRLRSICNDFQLNVDLERLIEEQDENGNDSLDFYEFSHMFSTLCNTNRKKSSAYHRKQSDPFGSADACDILHKRSIPKRRSLVQENQAHALIENAKFPLLMSAESVMSAGATTKTLSLGMNQPNDKKQAQALMEKPKSPLLMDADSVMSAGTLHKALSFVGFNLLKAKKQTSERKMSADEGGDVPTVETERSTHLSEDLVILGPRPPPGKSRGPTSSLGVSRGGRPAIPHPVPKVCHPVFNSSAPRLDPRGKIVPLRPAGGTAHPLTARPHPRDVQATLEARVVKATRSAPGAGKKRRKPRGMSPVEDWEVYNPFSCAPSVLVTEPPPSWKPLELPSFRTPSTATHSPHIHRYENISSTKITPPLTYKCS